MTTLQELAAQKADLEKRLADINAQAEAARLAERADVIASIKATMAAHDIRLSDLGTPRARAASSTPRERKANPLAGKKVPAKYTDGAGNTWSGRGLKPNWLRAAIMGGRKVEDFAVTA